MCLCHSEMLLKITFDGSPPISMYTALLRGSRDPQKRVHPLL